MLFIPILLPKQTNFKKKLGQFENLGFVIMSTRENIRLIARAPLSEFIILPNLHLCTQKPVSATNFRPFGEICAIFSLKLSTRTQFAKIRNEKVMAENQCEKHKNSCLIRRCCLSPDQQGSKDIRTRLPVCPSFMCCITFEIF